MNPIELASGILLVVLLLVLAGYFALRQRTTLELLRRDAQLSAEDRRYLHGQVSRRLLSSFLMVVLAGFLIGWYYFLDEDFRRLQPPADIAQADEEWKNTFLFYTAYWVGALLILLAIMALAAYDLIATARFGLRHQRQLQIAHRALMESEAARLREDRQ